MGFLAATLPFYRGRASATTPFQIVTLSSTTEDVFTRIDHCGESGAKYRLVHPLGKGRDGTAANVWKAIRESDDHSEFVAKGPSKEDDKALNWPAFCHEIKMQRLFSKDSMIQHMVDFAPRISTTRPMMILKPFQKTL